jgi:class 3 adenylate cyclase
MTAKILIVDDEPDLEQLVRQKFRRQIREKSYEFVFATNGQEALAIIEEHGDIDAVFSDINMPVMDGLTLLLQLHSQNPLIKSVIVSAYNDMDNIRLAMNRGAFDFICKPIQFNDLEITLEKTIKQVQQTRETLQAIRENNILRMYVDDSVLDFMADKKAEKTLLVNETVEASIVFMDICGFTAMSERETPNFVVNLINKYFDIMVKEIIAHQGHVDKFLGDAIMAIFRGAYHVDRAIEAALAVIKAIEAQQENLSNAAIFLPKLSIGINSGEVISGNIGSAALKRLDYTVIGDAVNTAQRLQSAAKPGQIVISKQIYEDIKHAFRCREVGEIKVKNKANPIMIYEVLD